VRVIQVWLGHAKLDHDRPTHVAETYPLDAVERELLLEMLAALAESSG
jgi:hypothetical protein